MPTRLPPLPAPRPPRNRLRKIAALLALAAGAALVELLAGLLIGAFPLTGRAEAFAFLVYRPWAIVLLALVLATLRWRWPWRAAAYLAFLLLAGFAEAIYMLQLGNAHPWAEMLRGWAAGALAALAADAILIVAARRGRWWAAAAALVLGIVVALPAVRGSYERLVTGPARAPSGARPEVLLMTALPLVWGEGGAFDPNSRPAAIYTALQQEFTLKPVDGLDDASLGKGRTLLLIQPRWLAPEELVALDSWVRRGGKALILTDPKLGWHSELPLGDIRRPPPAGLLKPLLDHWGLGMEPGPGGRAAANFERGRLLQLETPGRLTARGRDCRLQTPFLANCRVGLGRARLLADVDIVRDELWAAPGPQGGDRNRRVSDNVLVVADLLDGIIGVSRSRAAGDVRWRDLTHSPAAALLRVLLPLAGLALAASLVALLLARRRAR